jgi:tetratricopeptide (TPR) repeat protein
MSNLSSLLRRAETCRLRGDNYNAHTYFDAAIGEIQAQHRSQQTQSKPDYIWNWAWAHKGEVYYHQGEYNQALICFNKALSLEETAIGLSDRIYDPNQVWALAHRGETLRALGNECNNNDVQTIVTMLEGAIDSFNKALELDDQYAWAYAHRGAARCNGRGFLKDGKAAFDKALQDLEKAIELSSDEYGWCFAYKAVAYTLKNEPNLAFYALFAAGVQDRTFFNKLFYPALEFRYDLSEQELYGEALGQYNIAYQAYKKQTSNSALFVRVLYHHAVMHNYAKYSGVLFSKPAEVKQWIDELQRYLETHQNSSLSTLLTYITESQNSFEEWQDAARNAVKRATNQIDQLPCDLEKDYLEGGLLALDKNTEEDALKKLRHVISDPQGQSDDWKRRAREDIAWYNLRGNADFQQLVAGKPCGIYADALQ